MTPQKPQQSRKKFAPPRHSQPPLATSQIVQIEKPIYGGAFLARMEGKAVFVPLALPGEEVRVLITQSKRGYDTADPEEIIAAAAERIVPACPHFGACGGCHYQHTGNETQLQFKQAILHETLQRGDVEAPSEIAVLSADPWHYRNRIRLAFDAEGNPGYRARMSHSIVPIRECPIAAPLLVEAALAFAELPHKIAPSLRPSEISLFCNGDESALLASVFAVSAQKARFEDLAIAFHERIPALQGAELALDGSKDEPHHPVAQWGAKSLTYRTANFDYRVDHGAFFQVNRWLIDGLVDCVCSSHSGKLAWDLFAGVGLFARALAASFDRVVAVEFAPSAIKSLEENLKGTAATAVAASTLDFLRRSRKGDRPDFIVVDPPRTGLGPDIIEQLVQIAAPALVYVSCDPATLARDLSALLAKGYLIQSITLADLFPQTFHLETVVHLRLS